MNPTKATPIKKGAVTKRMTTAKKKALFLELLEAKAGNVTEAAKAANIDRGTVYRWKREDPKFSQAVADADESLIDRVESALLNKIDGGDTTAIIFFLKTRGRNRGYNERVELEATHSPGPSKIILCGPDEKDLSEMSEAEVEKTYFDMLKR